MTGFYTINYKVPGDLVAAVPPEQLREFLEHDIGAHVEALILKIEDDRTAKRRAFAPADDNGMDEEGLDNDTRYDGGSA